MDRKCLAQCLLSLTGIIIFLPRLVIIFPSGPGPPGVFGFPHTQFVNLPTWKAHSGFMAWRSEALSF